MTKILIEGYKQQSSFTLNVEEFKKFATVWPIEIRSRMTKDITPEDIEWCDILIDVRGGNPLSAYVVGEAKKAGRKVYLSLDDDLMETYPQNYEGDVFRKSLIKVMSNTDRMITSSKYLGEKYKYKYGIDYTVVDTVVEPSQFKEDNTYEIGNHVEMLYAAGSQHIPFFDKLIKPILNQLHDRFADKLSLTIIGPDIEVSNVKLNVHKFSSMPFNEYRKFMDDNHFDIGLAPLFDSEFCRSKYFNKYLEYSTNNICGIYSNVMPYTLVVEDGENGILADNNPESWLDAICKLLEKPLMIKNCSLKAKEHILSNFSLVSITERTIKEIPELFSYEAPPCAQRFCRFMRQRYLYYAIKRRLLSSIF